jgi:hypothetical protein
VTYDRAGVYQAVLIVTDDKGAQAQDVADVLIERANVRPEVRITYPSPGEQLRGYIVVRGTSTDDRGVARVEVRVDDGAWKEASGTLAWTFDLSLDTMEPGVHTIRARAVDAAGAESQVVEVQFEVLGKKKKDTDDTPGFALPLVAMALLVMAAVMVEERRRREKWR